MLRLSKLTDYAVVILADLAFRPGALLSAAAIALHTALPEPTVAKVLKILSRSGLVSSVRGMNGGYRVEQTAAEISIAAVIAAMEGLPALTECAVAGTTVEGCVREDVCRLHGRWMPVNAAIRGALESVTLADMLPPARRDASL